MPVNCMTHKQFNNKQQRNKAEGRKKFAFLLTSFLRFPFAPKYTVREF